MTTPNSCNSFFKKYLVYKLRSQTITFIISVLFNVLSLPLYAIQVSVYYISHSVNGSLFEFSDSIPVLSVIILFAMALTGGARTFDICTKKDHSDTLGSLPLTRREHFTADFLSGYIVNVGAFIPCGVFSIIMAICTNDSFVKYLMGIEIHHTQAPALHDSFLIEYFAYLTLALFLLYTFAYLFSVAVTVCSGKLSSSIIFTITVSGLMLTAAAGIGTFTVQCITGLTDNAKFYMNFIPPLGLLSLSNDIYCVAGNIDFSKEFSFDVMHPAAAVLLAAFGAALIFVSYYLFKNRKTERTGKAIAVNALYKTISTLAVASIAFISFSALYDVHAAWIPVIISIALSAILLLILEAVRGFKKAGLVISGIRGAMTLAVCFIAMLIIDKTGAFGARFINYSPDEIKNIRLSIVDNRQYSYYHGKPIKVYDEYLTFEDREDIERFFEYHNKTIKEYSSNFREGGSFTFGIELTNGEYVYRRYCPNTIKLSSNYYDQNKIFDELSDNVRRLPGYRSRAGVYYKSRIDSSVSAAIRVGGEFGEIELSNMEKAEFAEIFSREFGEKYNNSDKAGGAVFLESNSNEITRIVIPESCTETLEYARSLRDNERDSMALMIAVYNNSERYINYDLSTRELNGELGKELLSLLSTEPVSYSASDSITFTIESSDLVEYTIPKENQTRVIDILLKLIESGYSADTAL